MHYERLSQPMLSRPRFMRRLAASASVGLMLIAISLLVGMAGYHWLVRLSWIDAYENAAMILSGMGPVATPDSWAGKFFAGSYALYSGIALLATTAVVFAPVVHRFLHYLHCDSDQKR
ncbi:MAG TPA: hypothetical protein VHN17_07040 [Steroidobacteraceae bacterium]|nr:hypothetical protein [Steroidobacteraceae bacterium]